jgi:hypothetical protein
MDQKGDGVEGGAGGVEADGPMAAAQTALSATVHVSALDYFYS